MGPLELLCGVSLLAALAAFGWACVLRSQRDAARNVVATLAQRIEWQAGLLARNQQHRSTGGY